MATTTTLARSSNLSRQYIADGWLGYTNIPEVAGHPRYEDLIDALVGETEKAADAMLPDGAQLFPHISEIVGEIGTELGDDYDADENTFDAETFIGRASAAVDYDAVEARVFGA